MDFERLASALRHGPSEREWAEFESFLSEQHPADFANFAGDLAPEAAWALLDRLNLDPATASAPLVTSIADATGVLIYFSLATVFLFPAL